MAESSVTPARARSSAPAPDKTRVRGVDPAEIRRMARAQLEEVVRRGQDPAPVADALRQQFPDAAREIEQAEQEARSQAQPQAGAATGAAQAGAKGAATDPAVDTATAGAKGAATDPAVDTATAGAKGAAPTPAVDAATAGAKGAAPTPAVDAATAGAKGAAPTPAVDAATAGAKGAAPTPAVGAATAGAKGAVPTSGAGAATGGAAGADAAKPGLAGASAAGAAGAATGKAGPLPDLRKVLAGDGSKYASEKAWHESWKAAGSPSAAGGQGVSFADRAALVGKALGKGAGSGFLRGVGELGVQMLMEKGGKKIPYLSAFIEVAQVVHDPKGWYTSNKAATVGKLGEGWSQAFGSGRDWVTRVEGIINLLDGVANVLGLLGTVCQIVAGVLLVGGLVLAIFGVGAALLAAAPFFGKAGVVLAEISTLIKIGTMGLRTLVMAGRALQILADGDASPADLAAKAENLEKHSEEWAKEFAKAKAKKVVDKWGKKTTPPAGGEAAKPADAAAGGPAPAAATPTKPATTRERIGSLARKAADLATADRVGEAGEKVKAARTGIQEMRAGKAESSTLAGRKKAAAEGEVKKAESAADLKQRQVSNLEGRQKALKTEVENASGRKSRLAPKRAELKKIERDLPTRRDELATARGQVQDARAKVEAASAEGEKGRKIESKVMGGGAVKDEIKDRSRALTGTGNEKAWGAEQAEELNASFRSVPANLPEPPREAETDLDGAADRAAEAEQRLKDLDAQEQALQRARADAGNEQAAVGRAQALTAAGQAETAALDAENQRKRQAIVAAQGQAQQVQGAGQKMQSGGADKTSTFLPFLTRAASLLGLVPSRMASGAAEGVSGARRAGEAVGQLGQVSGQTGTAGAQATRETQRNEATRQAAEGKIATGRTSQAKATEAQSAAAAEIQQGQADIEQAAATAAKVRAQQAAAKAKAEEDHAAAKKRLVSWALLHERMRAGQEANLDGAVQQGEASQSR